MVEIFESKIEDAERIDELIPEFDPLYIQKNIRKLENSKTLILSASISKKDAGYAICYDRYNDGSTYLWLLGVVPEAREHGVMNALMQYIYNWAKKEGYKSIKVKTQNFRKAMLIALIKNGFNFLEVEDSEDINTSKILLEKLLI